MAPKLGMKRKGGKKDVDDDTSAVKAAKKEASVSAFRAPEASEVLEIARTQNLYKSNLFRLQMEELVKELAPARSHPQLEEFLRGLHPIIQGLAARTIPERFTAEFPSLCFHQRQPFPFSFAAPRRVDVVGSFLLGTCLRTDLHADVVLEMPPDAFQSKDYLNFRYSDKRAAYVGELHRQLTKLCNEAREGVLADMEVGFEALQGDVFRPCVTLQPSSKGSKDSKHGKATGSRDTAWLVRLLPVYPAALWTASKLAPDRNCVRPLEESPAALPPTAYYNSSVLEDASMRNHLEFLHRAIKKTPALRDAILLLKRWAIGRGFLCQGSSTGVFTTLNGFCLSMLAAHAGETANIAHADTSSFQLFKLSLSTLASTDWATQKLTLGQATTATSTDAERQACGAHFYDSDGFLNFFCRLGPFITEIRAEAQRSLKILDDRSDAFDAVFGLNSSPELLWDYVVRTQPLGPEALCPDLRGVAVPASLKEAIGSVGPANAPKALSVGENLARVLAAGLGDRCLGVRLRLVGEQRSRWHGERPVKSCGVLAGLQLEAQHLERTLDRGPAAQETAACARFRGLWGPERSELRRFKDGSILECAVWAKPPPQRKVESRKSPAVVTQIVRHLLTRHFAEVAPHVDLVAGPLGFVPQLEERGKSLWVAFEAFRTHLCQLSSLPLAIKDIHPVDEAFSYTMESPCIAPPAAGDDTTRTLHGVVVEFESSGRWPDHPEAARKVGGALLLQMQEELLADLGIESDVCEDFLDVRYPGVVFRVRLFHPAELVDAAHRVTNFQARSSAALPTEEAMERLRSVWWRPRLRAAMHSHCLRQPAVAGAVKLCKRWAATQLLAGYEDFIEHLVASVFLQPAPFEAPTSAQVGFCRMCWLLDTFDWQREPLVVDFDGKLSEEDRLSIRQSFEGSRAEAAGSSSFWICSRFDPHAILLPCPPATVTAWLRRRASHALSVYNKRLLGLSLASVDAWQPMFAVDTSVFDIIVRLLPQADANVGLKKARRKALATRAAINELVAKLRAHLSPVCLVFHDVDSRLIALKWRPGAFFPQPQNVLMGAVPHTILAQKSDFKVRHTDPGQSVLCVPNVLCITSTIASLTEGLATEVSIVAG